MSERQGIEIDYCPQCRGIWLDRGELDKILERAQAEAEAFAAQQAPQPPVTPAAPAAPQTAPPLGDHYSQPVPPQPAGYGDRGYDRRDRGYDRDRDDRKPRYDDRGRGGYGDPRYRKKKSPFEFLGDIFDS